MLVGLCAHTSAHLSARRFVNIAYFMGVAVLWIVINFVMCARLDSLDTFLSMCQLASVLGSLTL